MASHHAPKHARYVLVPRAEPHSGELVPTSDEAELRAGPSPARGLSVGAAVSAQHPQERPLRRDRKHVTCSQGRRGGEERGSWGSRVGQGRTKQGVTSGKAPAEGSVNWTPQGALWAQRSFHTPVLVGCVNFQAARTLCSVDKESCTPLRSPSKKSQVRVLDSTDKRGSEMTRDPQDGRREALPYRSAQAHNV